MVSVQFNRRDQSSRREIVDTVALGTGNCEAHRGNQWVDRKRHSFQPLFHLVPPGGQVDYGGRRRGGLDPFSAWVLAKKNGGAEEVSLGPSGL